ncbi:uncharacterized protein LOC133186425 [Saccostrea echinata]|uniref:uncharacterized protein LOC133186425 n=1 Tax=Saccostrea echinata TaxID=191078 RepID=UPI002A83E0F6|nr:uncharacterized protein LOC133186425 [Saccostrea echinata]
MSSESVAVVCCLSCLLLPSVVLQTSGFFSPYWIKQNSTTDCFRGIFSTVDCDDSIKGLGATILGLQSSALIIIALTTVVLLYTVCRNKDDEEDGTGFCDKFGLCLTFLYPVAGIISFAGCMLVVSNYKNHEKGWGFYLCLAASCYVMIEIIICCCALCKLTRSKENTDLESGQGNSGYVGQEVGQEVVQYGASGHDNQIMSPSDGGEIILTHVQEHHQLEVSSTGTLLIRKLQVARVFHIS